MEILALLNDCVLLFIDNFDARGEDELTLRRGEKVELVELDEGFGDGWYLGKHTATGKTGLFPGGIHNSLLLETTYIARHFSTDFSAQFTLPSPRD